MSFIYHIININVEKLMVSSNKKSTHTIVNIEKYTENVWNDDLKSKKV